MIYARDKNTLKQVHSILFIYKLKIPKDHEITKKDNFSVLDKDTTKLFWVGKEETKKSVILPEVSKRLLDISEFRYDVIDDTEK